MVLVSFVLQNNEPPPQPWYHVVSFLFLTKTSRTQYQTLINDNQRCFPFTNFKTICMYNIIVLN